MDDPTHQPGWLFDAVSATLDITDKSTLKDLKLGVCRY
jgi:hypothetical protein